MKKIGLLVLVVTCLCFADVIFSGIIRDYDVNCDFDQMVKIFNQNPHLLLVGSNSLELSFKVDLKTGSFCTDTSSATLAVYDDEDIVKGFIGFCKPDKNQIGHIEYLAVDSKYRGKGYASLLVQHAISELTKQGARRIEIGVIEGNAPAESLYKKLGFVPVRKQDISLKQKNVVITYLSYDIK